MSDGEGRKVKYKARESDIGGRDRGREGEGGGRLGKRSMIVGHIYTLQFTIVTFTIKSTASHYEFTVIHFQRMINCFDLL